MAGPNYPFDFWIAFIPESCLNKFAPEQRWSLATSEWNICDEPEKVKLVALTLAANYIGFGKESSVFGQQIGAQAVSFAFAEHLSSVPRVTIEAYEVEGK